MKYELILFDIHGTLVGEEKGSSPVLENVLSRWGLDYDEVESLISEVPRRGPGWTSLRSRLLQAEMFNREGLKKRFLFPGGDAVPDFLSDISHEGSLVKGAKRVLSEFSSCCRTGVVANGFSSTLFPVLKNTGLLPHIDHVIFSGDTGLAKPHAGIFKYALSKAGITDAKKVLMVGDGLSTDILGGVNAGIDTCWYNPSGQGNPYRVKPDYEIGSLLELLELLCCRAVH